MCTCKLLMGSTGVLAIAMLAHLSGVTLSLAADSTQFAGPPCKQLFHNRQVYTCSDPLRLGRTTPGADAYSLWKGC